MTAIYAASGGGTPSPRLITGGTPTLRLITADGRVLSFQSDHLRVITRSGRQARPAALGTLPGVEADTEGAFEPGDRVAAAHDLDTQGLHIPAGTEGTVAEDRGSRLVVSFDDQASAASFEEQDLRSSGEASPCSDR